MLIAHGKCPLEEGEFGRFIERLGPRVATEPLVLNRGATSSPTWFYPEVREIISVPIREGNRLFGWLLALNHTGAGDITNSEAEFGTVEACLMASVATILGIHCGNIALYHEQSEFFSSVVRALTSAIDAKDPYTCGHSDRVARLSVCLARQLGCNKEDLNTIYLSGLLHDIGKIGIDDNVLRKPGPLTPAELEHIKTHPDLGCRILDGVKQLDKVMPVVRHHHEAWNGAGYPSGLKEEETPFLARDRGRGRFDRRHVERPAVPQRHARREARQHPARRGRATMGPEDRRGRVPGARRPAPHLPLGTQAALARRHALASRNAASCAPIRQVAHREVGDVGLQPAMRKQGIARSRLHVSLACDFGLRVVQQTRLSARRLFNRTLSSIPVSRRRRPDTPIRRCLFAGSRRASFRPTIATACGRSSTRSTLRKSGPCAMRLGQGPRSSSRSIRGSNSAAYSAMPAMSPVGVQPQRRIRQAIDGSQCLDRPARVPHAHAVERLAEQHEAPPNVRFAFGIPGRRADAARRDKRQRIFSRSERSHEARILRRHPARRASRVRIGRQTRHASPPGNRPSLAASSSRSSIASSSASGTPAGATRYSRNVMSFWLSKS